MKKLTTVVVIMAFIVGVMVLLPGIYAETSEVSDADGDGIPDDVDVDSDGDGIPDMQESVQGTNPYDAREYAFVEGIEEGTMQALGEEGGEEVEELL